MLFTQTDQSVSLSYFVGLNRASSLKSCVTGRTRTSSPPIIKLDSKFLQHPFYPLDAFCDYSKPDIKFIRPEIAVCDLRIRINYLRCRINTVISNPYSHQNAGKAHLTRINAYPYTPYSTRFQQSLNSLEKILGLNAKPVSNRIIRIRWNGKVHL